MNENKEENKEVSKKIIAERFAEVLTAIGKSIYDISRETDYISVNTFHNIIKGKFYPSFDFLLSISNYLDNLNMNWIINGRGEMFFSEENAPVNAPVNAPLSKENAEFNRILTNSIPDAKILEFILNQISEKDQQIRGLNASNEEKNTQIRALIASNKEKEDQISGLINIIEKKPLGNVQGPAIDDAKKQASI